MAFTVNQEKISDLSFPNKNEGYQYNSIECKNGVEAEWLEEEWALKIKNTNKQNKIQCTIHFTTPTLSEYLIAKTDSDEGIVKEEHEATEQTGNNAITDYRYIGVDPNNYVCLEENGECNDDNLYRIIGVIPTEKDESGTYENRVKLIKLTDYVGPTAGNTSNTTSGYGYSWTGNYDIKENDWSKSELNTKILNEEYWANINAYQKYIDPAKWYLGGIRSVGTKEIYVDERKLDVYADVSRKTSVITNIGLIYLSDYGFTTNGGDSVDRNTCLSSNLNQFWHDNKVCYDNSWIRNGNVYWTLDTPYNNFVNSYLFQGNMWTNTSCSVLVGIRPTFYLKAEVKYLSGTGEKTNPYRIMINE